MEVIEYVFKLAIGIVVLLFLGYLMSFITGAISKFFGTTSTLNGRIVSTPDTFDDNLNDLKELKNKFVAAYDKFKSRGSRKNEIDISEQIRLLSELEQLRRKGVINDNEYFSMKEKIVSE